MSTSIPPIVVFVIALSALTLGVPMLIIAIANFFEKVRRRRKAMMEDVTPWHTAWKNGDPNAALPGDARPVNFDPDEF